MGTSNSKIEDDKALLLCRERKRFVKQALAGRCLLAAAHVSYVQSLKNTGTALRKFVEPEVLHETSMHASTSTAPEPAKHSPRSASHMENGSTEFSPTPPLSGRFHVNHMTTATIRSMKIEERQPVVLQATVHTLSPSESHTFYLNHVKNAKVPSMTFVERPPDPVRATVQASPPLKSSQPHSEENFASETPPPSTPPWDYFGLFHPLDNQFSVEEGKMHSLSFNNADSFQRFREEEDIPELEDGGDQASSHDKNDDSLDSGDDFDQRSDEPLVQIYRNRNDESGDPSTDASLAFPHTEIIENTGTNTVSHHIQGTFPVNRKEEHEFESESSESDFLSCIKEIEILFLKASDSGGEVPRMLEANTLQIRPLFTEETAHKWKASTFLSSWFSCCKEDVLLSQVEAQAPTSNEVMYLTWHGSVSSRSSSTRIPFGASSKDEAEDLSNILFGSSCMNSGSHASTLDRLYAWERKLYDEVKASGFIRREYDLKCRLLRLQDSRAESSYKIDKTRAAVKDLHSRIRVAIHRINSISKSIEELRDKELQPQLEELIGGLTRMWAMMVECHKSQHEIISKASNKAGCKVAAQSESSRRSAMLLQLEISSLCSSFRKWMSALKSYLQAINNWLLKCVLMAPAPKQKPKRKQSQFSPWKDVAPPIFVACRDWLSLLDELPQKQVEDSLNDLIEVAALFLPRPEKSSRFLTSSLSLSRRVKNDERYEEIRQRETSVDWTLNYDSLQSGLVIFFERLGAFAESSLVKYEALQKTINEARVRYDNYNVRR